MGKYISDYIKYIEKILEEDKEDTDYEKLRADFLLKLSFFQHERFVHLVVTVMVAIVLFISVIYIFMTGLRLMAALSIILLGLVFAYLIYYYFIENAVMGMYKTYDRIMARIESHGENNKKNEVRDNT